MRELTVVRLKSMFVRMKRWFNCWIGRKLLPSGAFGESGSPCISFLRVNSWGRWKISGRLVEWFSMISSQMITTTKRCSQKFWLKTTKTALAISLNQIDLLVAWWWRPAYWLWSKSPSRSSRGRWAILHTSGSWSDPVWDRRARTILWSHFRLREGRIH